MTSRSPPRLSLRSGSSRWRPPRSGRRARRAGRAARGRRRRMPPRQSVSSAARVRDGEPASPASGRRSSRPWRRRGRRPPPRGTGTGADAVVEPQPGVPQRVPEPVGEDRRVPAGRRGAGRGRGRWRAGSRGRSCRPRRAAIPSCRSSPLPGAPAPTRNQRPAHEVGERGLVPAQRTGRQARGAPGAGPGAAMQ